MSFGGGEVVVMMYWKLAFSADPKACSIFLAEQGSTHSLVRFGMVF
jgi:hypothetical protein